MNEHYRNSRDGMSKLSATGRMTLASSNEDSPFYVPEDSEIFWMKEREKDRKKEERLKSQGQKIWEKGYKAKTGLTMKDLKEMTKPIDEDGNSDNPTKVLIEAAKSAIKNHVKSTYPMHDFIEKKREMLLFQMLIDHKRYQINEFEELTRLHRKGLEKAKQMLEEDTKVFNNHLNENKQETRATIKNAENMTRLKNDKVAIIKEKLETKADLTGKNTSKLYTLESLKTYKDFLDSLSPYPSEYQKRVKYYRKKKNKNIISNSNLNISPQIIYFLLEEDTGEEMYFKDPAQIVNIFVNLEESNLFLITNLKSIEQSIYVVKNSFAVKRKVLDAKNAELLNTKADMLKQIAQVEKYIEYIRIGTNKDDCGYLFNSLYSDIIKMYKEMGEKTLYDQKSISGFELLKEIEKRLESQVQILNEARKDNQNLIQNLYKKCFNDKKDKKRHKNEEEMKEMNNQQKMQEGPEREKRIGRPIMAKSKLKVEDKEQEVQDEGPKEYELDRRKYLT